MKKRNKKKPQFSKVWLISCIIISLVYTTASYVLAAYDKSALEELSKAIIETLWGTSGVSFVGYVIQNSVRAFTSSKFGIPEETKGGEEHGTQRHHCPLCGCDYTVDYDSVSYPQSKTEG